MKGPFLPVTSRIAFSPYLVMHLISDADEHVGFFVQAFLWIMSTRVDAEGKFLFGWCHSAIAESANHEPRIVEHIGFVMDRDPSVPASWVACFGDTG